MGLIVALLGLSVGAYALGTEYLDRLGADVAADGQRHPARDMTAGTGARLPLRTAVTLSLALTAIGLALIAISS